MRKLCTVYHVDELIAAIPAGGDPLTFTYTPHRGLSQPYCYVDFGGAIVLAEEIDRAGFSASYPLTAIASAFRERANADAITLSADADTLVIDADGYASARVNAVGAAVPAETVTPTAADTSVEASTSRTHETPPARKRRETATESRESAANPPPFVFETPMLDPTAYTTDPDAFWATMRTGQREQFAAIVNAVVQITGKRSTARFMTLMNARLAECGFTANDIYRISLHGAALKAAEKE